MPIFTFLPFVICDGESLSTFHGIRAGAEPDLPVSVRADLVDSDPVFPDPVVADLVMPSPVMWVK